MFGDFVTIARVVKTQGRRGEVACDVFTDFPEKFSERERVFLQPAANRGADVARREAHIESHWMHGARVVLKFRGVDDMDAAAALVGFEVQIPERERAPVEQGTYYISDLEGCRVFDSGREIGVVERVDRMTSATPLLVVRSARGEVDVPFAEVYIESVDVAAKEIRMKLPDGILEINRD